MLKRVTVNKIKLCLIAAFILSIAFISNASSVIYVDADSPNEPGTGTFDDPFRKIQDAIDSGSDGNTVEIQPGVYTGQGNYNLDPAGKSLTIRSIEPNDAGITAGTIIDPNKAGRGFFFHSGEDANCVISGLTIKNGYAANNSGGGIFCSTSSPAISRCIITNNSADVFGGGIYCYFSNPEITDCTISGNQAAEDGGGLEIDGGAIGIANCIIADNQASGLGGGADFYNSSVVLTNCTLAGNSANSGGGLCNAASDMTVRNCILWKNDAVQGPEAALMTYSGVNIVTVSYSNIRGGQTTAYDPCDGMIWGSGNIDTDPCFVSFNPAADPNLWDFHLQSIYGRWDSNIQNWVTDLNTSVCIDAGDPNADWQSEIWPNGKRVNMGAYGGTNQASMNGNRADFNIDNKVDFLDFAEFSIQWMTDKVCIEDLNGNGTVNFADAAVFVENWLWQKE